MSKVVVFLIVAALLALGLGWFADRPGELAITWLGYRIETSVLVGVFAVALLAAFFVFVWSVYRAILHSPEHVSLLLRHRRSARGYLAISRGLIAIGAGDVRTAQLSASEAARLAPDDPLTLLLGAQSAQLTGDRVAAERAFRALAGRADTRQLGLRGLYVEAQRRNDTAAARRFAEEAASSAPGASWASQAVLEDKSAAGDWIAALDLLERMRGSLDKATYRRQRAVLLTARALTLENSDRDAARVLAIEAAKLAPDLVPAVALGGRLLGEQRSFRKAAKILEAAWIAGPHPDIAAAYGNLRSGDSARERRVRIRRLVDKGPEHVEGALALAQASLDVGDCADARAALARYAQAPTQRVASMMAAIAEAEGDIGRSREWLSRAMRAAPDPAWTADGVISENWLPVSPVTGRLDAFQWKQPLAEIGIERAMIEPDVVAPEPEAPALPAAPPEISPPPAASPEAVPVATAAMTEPAARPSRARSAKPRPAEEIIPLVHAPDDPGPNPQQDHEPVPEPTTPQKGWRQFFQ
jgi:HemY protein